MRVERFSATLAFALLFGGLAAADLRAQLLDDSIEIYHGRHETRLDGDRMHLVIRGAFLLRYGDTVLRAGKGVLSFDRDEFYAWLSGRKAPRPVLPRRESQGPEIRPRPKTERSSDRSVLDPLDVRDRGVPAVPLRKLTDLLQQVHLAEGVTIESAGHRYLRCAELFLSIPSRRFDAREAELRLPPGEGQVAHSVPIYVRAPRIVQQGQRLIARHAIFAASDQGVPSTRVRSEQLVLTRLGPIFEIAGTGNELLLGDLPSVPLPDFRRYSDDDSSIPIKSISVGSSDSRGIFGLVTFGGRWHELGQEMFDWVAGGAPRFRGNWRLRTGWMQERGTPVEPYLDYELEGIFRGELDAYFLDDSGTDVRSPIVWLNGELIEKDVRTMLRTQNRLTLSPTTDLDLEVFQASDAGTLPEFREGVLAGAEVPETALYLRWAQSNMRASLSGRWNVNEFAYGDDNLLTDRFRREEPEARFDLFGEPLLEIVDDVPLVSSVSMRAGRLGNDVSSRAPGLVDQESERLDARVELSAPISMGVWSLRFHGAARETWYSEIQDGDAGGREAFEVGATLSTRWARSFDLGQEFEELRALRHEILPQARLLSRFEVSRGPDQLYDFDEVEELDELSALDLVLLQRLHGTREKDDEEEESELVWLDLEQRFHLNPDRDNEGDVLGLFKWELLLRPSDRYSFLFEGEHDWDQSRDKTRNLALLLRPLDWLSLGFGWRAGFDGQGTGYTSGGLQLWRRWMPNFSYIYNFELDRSELWSVGLLRRDYDWEWSISMTNDILSNDRSFQIRFQPILEQRLRRDRPFDSLDFGSASRASY